MIEDPDEGILLGQREVASTPKITPFQQLFIPPLSEYLFSPDPAPGIVQSRNLMVKKAIQTSVPTDHGEA